MKKFLDQPMTIAFEKNFPEVILGLATTGYGLMLTLPPDSFLHIAGYGLMHDFAPTWVWGIVFLGLGLTSMYAVLNRKGDIVRFTAKLLFFAWFFAAFLFIVAAPTAPGWILLLCMAILYAGVSSEYRTKSKWHDDTDLAGPDL